MKDRLASYIYFKTKDGLDQAVLVATVQEVNLASIKKWCKNENSEWAFNDFLDELKKKNKK